jgi:hypothetical protein
MPNRVVSESQHRIIKLGKYHFESHGGTQMPNVELNAVFYLEIPDEVDPDDVTIEVSDDGVVSFFANGEEVATHDDLEGWETESVFAEDDDEDDDEDEEEESV